MPAGKSPNNAFNLHKNHMKHVFSDICRGLVGILAPTLIPSCRRRRHRHNQPRRTISSNNQQSSKPYFYWEKHPYFYGETHHSEDQWELYSKGYIMTYGGGIWSGKCEGYFNTTIVSITGDGDGVDGFLRVWNCERDVGIRLLITKVREYYTDGVRPIGAME